MSDEAHLLLLDDGPSLLVPEPLDRVDSGLPVTYDEDGPGGTGTEDDDYSDMENDYVAETGHYGSFQLADEPPQGPENPVQEMRKVRRQLIDKIHQDRETQWKDETLWKAQKSYDEYKRQVKYLLELEREFLTEPSAGPSPTNFLQHVLEKAVAFSPYDERLHKAKFFLQLITEVDSSQLGPKWGPKPLHAAAEFDIALLKDDSEFESDLTIYLCNLMDKESAEAICQVNEYKENILHLAISHNLTGLEQLIQRAGKSAFRQQRVSRGDKPASQHDDGNTPLHDALDIKRFIVPRPICRISPTAATKPPMTSQRETTATKTVSISSSEASSQVQSANTTRHRTATSLVPQTEQVRRPAQMACQACLEAYDSAVTAKKNKRDIINLLLKQDKDVLTIHNSAGLSPYLYLLAGSQKAERDDRSSKNDTESGNVRMQEKTPAMDSSVGAKKKDSDQPNTSQDTKNNRESYDAKDKKDEELKKAQLESRTNKDGGAQSRTVNGGNRNAALRKPIKNRRESHTTKNLPSMDISDDFLKGLKESAFQLGGSKKAYEFLFRNQSAPNPSPFDNELGRRRRFTLAGKQRISRHTETNFDFLIFEPMMASVVLSLEYTKEELQAMPTNESDRLARWREDEESLKSVFDWLKSKKGVKTILNLTVKENVNHYCSDDTVEKCLEGLEVRYLNWNRPDMCANESTLPSDLIEISLYWTGLNAVLWSWSDTGGLRTLKKLQQVYLYIQRGVEYRELQDAKVDAFRKRIEEWKVITKPKLIVRDDNRRTSGSGNSSGLSSNSTIPTHPWLKAASSFCGKLYTGFHKEANISARPFHIKVALLDDGVDPTYDRNGAHIHNEGWPAIDSEDPEEGTKSFYVSTNQHGSKMASLIRKVCPFVTLYVAKLDMTSENNLRHRTFSLQQAKEAIEWATNQNVDIISMSWNARQVNGPQGNEEDVRQLEHAINNAYDKNILMIGAACDVKERVDKWVPCDDKKVWSIGATDMDSDAKKYVDVSKVDYLFPGEHLLEKPEESDVGNSGATALAAGLAALVLCCMKIDGERLPENKKQWMDRIMAKVFDSETNKKVVHVKDVLRLDKLEELRTLVRKFASQN